MSHVTKETIKHCITLQFTTLLQHNIKHRTILNITTDTSDRQTKGQKRQLCVCVCVCLMVIIDGTNRSVYGRLNCHVHDESSVQTYRTLHCWFPFTCSPTLHTHAHRCKSYERVVVCLAPAGTALSNQIHFITVLHVTADRATKRERERVLNSVLRPIRCKWESASVTTRLRGLD